MADTNTTTRSIVNQAGFEYNQQLWGDLIYGTKAQLQAIGIAEGLKFPGEHGGPRLQLKVIDPRGFPCKLKLSTHKGEGIYSAQIFFPGRERTFDDPCWTDYAPGVQVSKHIVWCDEYVGTADALVESGPVRHGWFPGMPGMRKVTVSILPDGSLPAGAPTANCSDARKPGAKHVQRAGKNRYRVHILVPEGVENSRIDGNRRAESEWERRMRQLPRPAPLIDLPSETRSSRQVSRESEKSESACLTEYDWMAHKIKLSSVLLDTTRGELFPDGGEFHYTDASSNRILRAMSELRTAVQEGVAVRREDELKRDGNVIHFPRRSA